MTNKPLIGSFLYALFLVLYIYTLKYQEDVYRAKKTTVIVNEKYSIMKKKWFYFFTIWTFMAQIFFLLISIVDELLNVLEIFSQETRKRINGIRSYEFQTIVLPCSAVVVTIFWTLFLYDRELIFPKDIDEFLPVWCNHVLHTVIVLPCLIELWMPKIYNFITFQKAFIGLSVYLAVYQILFTSVYLNDNVWLYPIYAHLSWPQRFLFTLIQYGIAVGVLWLGIKWQNSKKTVERQQAHISFKLD